MGPSQSAPGVDPQDETLIDLSEPSGADESPGAARPRARGDGEEPCVTAERAGLLIVRAWVEEGSSVPLRAQIRLSSDISTGFERTLTVTSSVAVCETVTEWLADVVRQLAPAD